MSKVLVIGGGPAGCFAAIAAAEQGHQPLSHHSYVKTIILFSE